MHAVILVILKCLFILVCRSKSPTGLLLHVVQYSTQNKNSMSMFYVYVYAMKNSFFPWTIPQWISLSFSMVNSQTTEEFMALFI